jgi:dipeptidyl-peptidase III
MIAESNEARVSPFIDPSEAERFKRDKYPACYLWVVLHELLGHGTGKMMVQQSENTYNFDIKNPPLDLVTKEPIKTWFRPGQTWTGQFEDLATTVDECRAELVGAYLMDDPELLDLFGYNDKSTPTAEDRKLPDVN